MDTPTMTAATKALADAGFRVARFEFAYMAARRGSAGRKPPPRAEKLCPEYLAAIATSFPSPVFPSLSIMGFGEVWRNRASHQGSVVVRSRFPYQRDREGPKSGEKSVVGLPAARVQQLCTQRLELAEAAGAGSDG